MPGFAGRLGGLTGFGDRKWSRLLVLAAVAAGVAGFVVLISAVAFVAEERANSRKVVRNVTLAGRNSPGNAEAQVRRGAHSRSGSGGRRRILRNPERPDPACVCEARGVARHRRSPDTQSRDGVR